MFVAGVWLMRAAGCVVNDYADRKFDGHVKRTANRPLPSGAVTEKEARAAVCSAGTDFIFTGADAEYDDYSVVDCRAGAGVGVPVYEAVYPSTTSGAGRGVWLVDSMAFAAVSESVPLSCWLMFLANILWAVAYDTQYAMVDRDDDVKIGIKSTAILFGQYDKLIIGILQIGVSSADGDHR
ncbi:4-hydroxybenzoate octaprenyltransferase [Escherichia coli]|uniref:4-hydroxybenzoate polyprenyltransferase n=1 Tax=Escherichia coli TaxID=562 RepID=A0A377KEN2_ECOLX|nr:4-hydroxybenzoate octaprenyltransferase [Escherichia coli]